MGDDSRVTARRAIEALRSGVPNRDVVGRLGVFQGDVTQRFVELREETRAAAEQGDESRRSLVVSGGFGSGKSHLLEYLRHESLEHNCVCSHLVISKETPLFDALKLLRTAAETAKAPGKAGRAVPEIVYTVFTEQLNSPEFDELLRWARTRDALGERIASLLTILQNPKELDPQMLDSISREWSGYPMKVSQIRAALNEIGQHKAYSVGMLRQGDLGDVLWRFLPRLFRAAGYDGWVVLFDEIELILRYGKLQRAKSYAQIARLAGLTKQFKLCGFLPVFAVSNDFWTDAENKRDSEIAEWLRVRKKPVGEQLARDAEAGMNLLKRTMPLRDASPEERDRLKEKVRQLHSEAFGWEAPPPKARETLASQSVREHVKSWITEWDLMLLYPKYRAEIVAERVEHDYSEDKELSREDKGLGDTDACA